MKKNKKYTIDIDNIDGPKKKREIVTSSLEEAMEFVKKLTDENIHVAIFDDEERIVYSKHHKVKPKEHNHNEDNGNHYGHSHGHHNHHGDDDDSYC